jgi:tetratricopeptide (TPR) repeat protein
VAVMSDKPEVGGPREQEDIISALYAQLEETFLPAQHPAYDVESGLRRLAAWMETHPEAMPDSDEQGLGLGSGGVFVNYRGVDTGSYGALLHSELSRRFGAELVFLDAESIRVGAVVDELLGWVRRCRVMLAVVGPGWLATAGADGRRRIDDPSDWVRRELAEAFTAGARVIPVLTDGADLPAEADLPADIAALGRCQYRRLRHREATADVDRICADLAAADPALAVAAGRRSTLPRQLPADVSAFAGRAGELADLDRGLLASTGQTDPPAQTGDSPVPVVISAVSGAAGVGKTALAVRWAHHAQAAFPDGQLYVDLRGNDPDQPMTPADALAGFLTGLGLSGQDIPVELDDRAARYRTELAGRRLLVVLDNASSVDQVRPLLPDSGSAMVVVTSRDSLPELATVHGARLDLDLLPLSDAIALLRTLIGPRVGSEPTAAAALAEQCARLPLALRVAAELAVSRPTASLAGLATELGDLRRLDRQDRLDVGGGTGAAVRAVFSWSYQHLPPDAARAFRLIGLHPGPDFDPYAVAALADATLDQARVMLELLTRAHLVQPTASGRYGLHDLLRVYAMGQASSEDTEDQRRAALHRLFDYYLATAAAAMSALHPADARSRPRVTPATTPAPALADLDIARDWLDAERPTLAAVAAYTAGHGWPTHTIRLAGTLCRYLYGGHHTEALTVYSHARRAARRTGDLAGEAEALTGLGTAHWQPGRYSPAADYLEQALALFRRAGDQVGEARALCYLGNVHDRMARYELAAGQFEQALALFRRAGDRVGEARALGNLGLVHWRMGRYELAAGQFRQAVALFRRAGDQVGEAWALSGLGLVDQRLGQHRPAAERHHQALALFRKLGDRGGEANVLDYLGSAYTGVGQTDLATKYHRQALSLSREIGDRDTEAWTLNGLGEAAHAARHPADAFTWHNAADAVAAETDNRDQQARAHAGLGRAHAALGDPARARRNYERALGLYTELGQPEAAEVRAQLAALQQSPRAGQRESVAPLRHRRRRDRHGTATGREPAQHNETKEHR